MEHEARAVLLGAVIRDVVEICGEGGDELTLCLRDTAGADLGAVSIEADRLRLTYYPDYEAELAAIEIVDEHGKPI